MHRRRVSEGLMCNTRHSRRDAPTQSISLLDHRSQIRQLLKLSPRRLFGDSTELSSQFEEERGVGDEVEEDYG